MNTKHNTINTNDQGDPSGFYDALIEEHEEQAVLDCGCILDRSVAFETGAVAFTYCPMHDAAADLLAALEAAVAYLEEYRPKGNVRDIFTQLNHYENGVMKPARAAIAKATP